MRQPKTSLDQRVRDLAAIERALREGVRAALLRHKKLGESIVVWRDGRVVVVPPEDIGRGWEQAGGDGDRGSGG